MFLPPPRILTFSLSVPQVMFGIRLRVTPTRTQMLAYKHRNHNKRPPQARDVLRVCLRCMVRSQMSNEMH